MNFLFVRLANGKGQVKIIEEAEKLGTVVMSAPRLERVTAWAKTAAPGDVFFLSNGMICAVNDSVNDLRPTQ